MGYKVEGNYIFKFFFVTLLSFFICIYSYSQNNKIKCYFNRPVNNALSTGVNAVYLNGSFPDTIVAYINRAKYTLDIAMYNYVSKSGDALSKYATAVNNAKNRGVKVRWVYDGSSSNTGLTLLDTAIHTIGSPTSSSYGIMHNKFVVIDVNSPDTTDQWVLTGSCNWTSQQITTDYNNLIFFQSKSIAQLYYSEFNKMWGGTGPVPDTTLSKFGPMKTTSAQHLFTVNGTPVEVYFSPKDTTAKHLKSMISAATNELFFGIYTFTDNAIANLINTRLTAGISIKGIMDVFSKSYSPYTTLTPTLGANMIVYNGAGLYHNKILLKDALHPSSDPAVLTGSFNWSTAAQTKNDENTVIVHDPAIANQYYQSLCQNFTDMGGAACIAPMPVKLLSFKGAAVKPSVNELIWITTAEYDNAAFTLERSYNKINFSPVGTIQSAGNNNQENVYTYTDNSVENEVAYYRLKQIDKSGNFVYSFIIAVSSKMATKLMLYPNPATTTLNIKAPSKISAVLITDALGKVVKKLNVGARSNELLVNINDIASGEYFVQTICIDNKYVASFIKP